MCATISVHICSYTGEHRRCVNAAIIKESIMKDEMLPIRTRVLYAQHSVDNLQSFTFQA